VKCPAIVAWSDIFQLTPPHVRIVTRLASYGFVVVAPESYGRFEPKGTVFDFEADRQRALDASSKVRLEWIDEDVAAILGALSGRADLGSIGVIGWCFGGHVAFRAALDPRVRAAACCYATGVHDGKLGDRDGKTTSAGSLERAPELRGELLLVWGREDPHIPAAGRAAIHAALERANVKFESRLFDAEHTFMRDQGARYDAEAADRALAAIVDLFGRTLRSRP
jgi:carboxymethylenebutenolidase